MSAEKKDNKRLKVLHLIEALGSGGAERLLYTNLKHFDQNEIESMVVTVFSRANHWKEPIKSLGVEVISLGATNTKSLISAFFRLRAELKKLRPDIIHTHLWAANIIGRMAGYMLGIPVISSIHSIDYEPQAFDDGSGIASWKKWLVRTADKWTARIACKKILAVSEYVKQSVHKKLDFPSKKIEVLYNPTDVTIFEAAPVHPKAEMLRELGISENRKIILSVARISPEKGLFYAIEAMSEIRSMFPNTSLVAVGAKDDPKWLAKIESQIHELGLTDCVFLLGARNDIPSLLKLCDVFIFPSLHEGLGMALIEALASDCPCVASSTGPIPEFIENGVNGVLVPPKNSSAMAKAVSELLSDPIRCQELGRNAKKTVYSTFMPQPAADKLALIYRSVAER